MSAVMPVDLPIDEEGQKELKRGARRADKIQLGSTKRKLSSPWATAAALIIAILWTIPTFGLLVSSFRPRELIQTTGWWTVFENWGWTLDNYATATMSVSAMRTVPTAFLRDKSTAAGKLITP